jgi:hypothetical protein
MRRRVLRLLVSSPQSRGYQDEACDQSSFDVGKADRLELAKALIPIAPIHYEVLVHFYFDDMPKAQMTEALDISSCRVWHLRATRSRRRCCAHSPELRPRKHLQLRYWERSEVPDLPGLPERQDGAFNPGDQAELTFAFEYVQPSDYMFSHIHVLSPRGFHLGRSCRYKRGALLAVPRLSSCWRGLSTSITKNQFSATSLVSEKLWSTYAEPCAGHSAISGIEVASRYQRTSGLPCDHVLLTMQHGRLVRPWSAHAVPGSQLPVEQYLLVAQKNDTLAVMTVTLT